MFETLPVEMREAFESREISRLQDIAANMDEEVFSYHLKVSYSYSLHSLIFYFQRCIDSGLWVPNANGGEDEDDEEVDEVQPSTSNG